MHEVCFLFGCCLKGCSLWFVVTATGSHWFSITIDLMILGNMSENNLWQYDKVEFNIFTMWVKTVKFTWFWNRSYISVLWCICVYTGGQWVHAVPEAEPAWNSQRGRKEVSFPGRKALRTYTVTIIPYQQGTASFHWSSLAVCTQSYRSSFQFLPNLISPLHNHFSVCWQTGVSLQQRADGWKEKVSESRSSRPRTPTPSDQEAQVTVEWWEWGVNTPYSPIFPCSFRLTFEHRHFHNHIMEQMGSFVWCTESKINFLSHLLIVGEFTSHEIVFCIT